MDRSGMNGRKLIRYLTVAAAIVALLFFVTAGGILHHHNNASSEAHCPICHLTHQIVELSAQVQRVATPERLGPAPQPKDPSFVAGPIAPQPTTRAPPFA
jgi:hypothetical protein